MAFTLQVIRGATTYTISDPYFLEGAEGMGGASVRNIEESGPHQDGATHLDERLDPRTITLKLNVIGSSPSALDGYRNTLMTMFKPVRGVPITLKITRDDGSVRQIDTRRTGPLDIPLVAIHRPGNLHRAVVQLRAADPVWYDPTGIDVPFLGPSDWWLAFNTIGTANVLEHAENPGTAQLWTNSGSAAMGSPWTVFFRSANPGTAADFQYAFQTYDGNYPAQAYTDPGFGSAVILVSARADAVISALASGTANYFTQTNGGTLTFYQNTTAFGPYSNGLPTSALPGTTQGTATWRSRTDSAKFWPVALPYAAAYNIALSTTQRNALSAAVLTGGSAYNIAVPYTGDVDSYPVITIQGPITNPVIANTTTGDTLDFTGGTVGSADVWTIDLRYGRKSALNTSGVSVEQYLSTDSDLATFRLVPDPLATGGTNVISVAGTATGTATVVTLSYYTRYLSY